MDICNKYMRLKKKKINKLFFKIDGLVQEKGNSIANAAMELHLSCTKPSKCFLLMLAVMQGSKLKAVEAGSRKL